MLNHALNSTGVNGPAKHITGQPFVPEAGPPLDEDAPKCVVLRNAKDFGAIPAVELEFGILFKPATATSWAWTPPIASGMALEEALGFEFSIRQAQNTGLVLKDTQSFEINLKPTLYGWFLNPTKCE